MKRIKYITLALMSLITTNNTMWGMKKKIIQYPIIEKKFKQDFCLFYISPNFRYIAAQKPEGSVVLIDTKEDTIIREFGKEYSSVTFSPNSKFLAINNRHEDKIYITLYDIQNKKSILTVYAYAIFFTPDSKHVIFCTKNTIEIFAIEILQYHSSYNFSNPLTYEIMHPIFKYKSEKYKKISPDGQYLLISHGKKNYQKTELVNLHTQKTIKTFACKNFTQGHFSKDSQQLVICDDDESYIIFNIHNNEITEYKRGIYNNFSEFRINNKNFAVITNWNYLVKTFNLGEKEANKLFVSLQFSPDLRYMAKISSKKINENYDTDSDEENTVEPEHYRDIDEEKIELLHANKNDECIIIKGNDIKFANKIKFINNNLLFIFKYLRGRSRIYILDKNMHTPDNLTKKILPHFVNGKLYTCKIIKNKNKKYLVVSFQKETDPKNKSGYKIFDLDTFAPKTNFEKKLCDTQYQDIHIVTKK